MIAAGAVVTHDVPADHLWERGGRIVPINALKPYRMRVAPDDLYQ